MPVRFVNAVFLLFALLFTCSVNAFVITGQLKGVRSCWYPKIYLEAIHNIDGIYASSSENLLSSAPIDSFGNFSIEGNELPDDLRLYRLYVTPNLNITSQISTGVKRNYVLLFLNNQSKEYVSVANFCAPYFSYQVKGSEDNVALARIQLAISEFERAYANAQTDTHKKFLENRINQDLMNYASNTSTPYAALYALIESDINTNDGLYGDRYRDFSSKFSKLAPSSPYAIQLAEKLKIIDLQKEVDQNSLNLPWYVWILISILTLSLLFNIALFSRLRKRHHTPEKPTPSHEQLLANLTIKEREILQMIDQGLSNKEIADTLHIELSTTKSHVSRIYQKLNISNRKEVRDIAKNL